MKKRRLGTTELELTTVGLGTWAIGGPWEYGWGPQSDDDARAAINEALDAGINWIDTAPVYGQGHSESIVGQVIGSRKQKPIIATKCGLRWDDKRDRIPCLEAESIIEECEQSLKRLNIDTIDLYQMHWPDPDKDIEKAWQAMSTLKQQGKVRYIGASNFSVAQLERISKIQKPDSLQPPYSMLKRDAETELLDYCTQNKIGVIVYSPMQRGLLTGKFNAKYIQTLAPDDSRRRCPEFNEPKFSLILELVEKLAPIAEADNRPLAQLAISWVLKRKEITAAIVGARRPGQIIQTAPASDWTLNDEEIEQIDELLSDYEAKIKARTANNRE